MNTVNGNRYRLANQVVWRVGYGAMQLAGDGVFGPPRDRDEAVAVLRAAVDAGIDHIDTAQYYGHVVAIPLSDRRAHPLENASSGVSQIAWRLLREVREGAMH